jgi:hypothetical protein
MKIKFKKNRLFGNLLLGVVWAGIGVLNLVEDDNFRWSNYVYFVLGILYIGHFITDLTNQYLTFENGTLKKNYLYGFGAKINLDEVHEIKNASGTYTLITDTKKLKINTRLIEENSLTELHKILEHLNLPSDKMSFASNLQK